MKDFILKHGKEHIPHMKEQIWQIESVVDGDLTYYSKLAEAEFEIISQHFPDNLDNVMDLGCGLGRCGAYAYNRLCDNHRSHFVFCDSNLTALGNAESSVANNVEDSTYNLMSNTESFILLNDIKNYKVINFNEDKFLEGVPSMDLIVSMYSVGYHFSINEWVPKLSTITDKNTIFVLGVRNPSLQLAIEGVHPTHQSLDELHRCFNSVEIVDGLKPPWPQCAYLILKEKK